MNVKIYSIYDAAAGVFSQPFFLTNDAMAIRAFEHNVNNEDSQINKNPEHFTLFQIGEWDDTKGQITGHEVTKAIMKAIEVKTQEQNREETIAILDKKIDKLLKAVDLDHHQSH